MTTYPDYSQISSFVEDANFVEVVYADNVPTIASEDKESQNIQYDLLRKYVSTISKSGVLSKPTYSINTGTNIFKFNDMFVAVVNGHVVKVPSINIMTEGLTTSGTRNDIVFLEVFLQEVTKDSVIKKYGFENGSEVVSNKILSTLIGGETSKRIQLCSRLRYVSNASDLTDVAVLAQGPNGSPQVGKVFTKETGSEVYYNTSVNGVKGVLFAIPLVRLVFGTTTCDMIDLRVSSEVQEKLTFTPEDSAKKGRPSGYPELDVDGRIPASQLPSYVDDVIETYIVGTTYASGWLSLTVGGTALVPETGKVYVVLTSGTYQNKTYRWGGSLYVVIGNDLALGETSSTAGRGDKTKTAYDHSQLPHAPSDANFYSHPNHSGDVISSGDGAVTIKNDVITSEKMKMLWTQRTTPVDNSWFSVCYGNGMFVAVSYTGTGNRVMTSTDGITWTVRTTPADNDWYSVCYGNCMFVAVSYTGTGNQVMTSHDGINWTIRTTPVDNDWRSVCYGNGLFVAVASSGTNNRVMTSPNGITWTVRTTPVDNHWRSVCYGNGMFVAISSSGTGNRVMTSPDGINWTVRTTPVDNNWVSVCYGNGLFVAVSNSGTGNRVMTSPDGITWTIRTTPADNNWRSVCYGNGLFVAVAYSGTNNRVMTSPDGITWTIRTTPVDNYWVSVCYGNGLFVAVAISGTNNRVMTSGSLLIEEQQCYKSIMFEKTIETFDWSSSQYTIEHPVIMPTSIVEIFPKSNVTLEQLEALQGANIIGVGQDYGFIMIKAMGDVPTVSVEVNVLIRREV